MRLFPVGAQYCPNDYGTQDRNAPDQERLRDLLLLCVPRGARDLKSDSCIQQRDKANGKYDSCTHSLSSNAAAQAPRKRVAIERSSCNRWLAVSSFCGRFRYEADLYRLHVSEASLLQVCDDALQNVELNATVVRNADTCIQR